MALHVAFVLTRLDFKLEKQRHIYNQNITEIAAPQNPHIALVLVERLIQTINRSLGCIKEAGKTQFNLKCSVYKKLYKLQNCTENFILDQSERVLSCN